MFDIDYADRMHCSDHLDDEVCCTCGHYHSVVSDCPDPDEFHCGDYRCCQP